MAKPSLSELLNFFEAGLGDTLVLLEKLVSAESCSLDKKGVDALALFLCEEFCASGAQVEMLPGGTRGNLLKATWKGEGRSRPIMVLGHLDTVWPRGTLRARQFTISDGRAYGPGVFDMKAGILLCLLACRALQRRLVVSGADVIFFFTSDEEIGTTCGLPYLTKLAKDCRAVLCLEPPLKEGGVKTFRKGVATYRILVNGVASHAGVDHEAGANAIVELCRLVQQAQSMTDYQRGITVNAGTIQGGTASNVVPASAEAEIDVRAGSRGDLSWMDGRIRGLKPADPRCRLMIEGGINRPPLERTEGVATLYLNARAIAAEIGMDLGEGATGGGSDGSFTADMGIPTLDGLGVGGDGAHSDREYIEVADIPRRAALLCGLIRSIAA
jgi:glutamate carboxypeptidase